MALYEITTEAVPLDFDCTMASDMVERTLQNAKNLIMCRKGEVPYDRQRGLDPEIFDIPYADAMDALIPELERALLWEPDVEVTDGWIDVDDEGETVIHALVEIAAEDEE